MKKNTITTLHKTLASVLLISQLLTSCGEIEIAAEQAAGTPIQTVQSTKVAELPAEQEAGAPIQTVRLTTHIATVV